MEIFVGFFKLIFGLIGGAIGLVVGLIGGFFGLVVGLLGAVFGLVVAGVALLAVAAPILLLLAIIF